MKTDMNIGSQADLPKLNRKVPPFFGWVHETRSGRSESIARGFNEAIIRIKLKLIRIEDKPYSDMLMEDLYKTLSETKFYEEIMTTDFEEFKH